MGKHSNNFMVLAFVVFLLGGIAPIGLASPVDLAGDLSFNNGVGGIKWGASKSASPVRVVQDSHFLGENIEDGEYIFDSTGFQALRIKLGPDSVVKLHDALKLRIGPPVVMKNDSRGQVWRWDCNAATILIEDVPLLGLRQLSIERLVQPDVPTQPSDFEAEMAKAKRIDIELTGDKALRKAALVLEIQHTLGDFKFELMGRVKKQRVYLEEGKLCFRTRFFEGNDQTLPIEDYLYEIPITAVDASRTDMKWNSFWSYGDIYVRSKDSAKLVRKTTFPSKFSRTQAIAYQTEFDIFAVKDRNSIELIKSLAELY